MALPRFQAENYTIAWQLVGNALPGTFAVRSVGCWLRARHDASIDLNGILLALVQRTQADFALSAPVGTWCSNTMRSTHARQPTHVKPITQHPLPCTWQARALGGLFPAAEADRLWKCTNHVLSFLGPAPSSAKHGHWQWITARCVTNCLRTALEPLRTAGRKETSRTQS